MHCISICIGANDNRVLNALCVRESKPSFSVELVGIIHDLCNAYSSIYVWIGARHFKLVLYNTQSSSLGNSVCGLKFGWPNSNHEMFW